MQSNKKKKNKGSWNKKLPRQWATPDRTTDLSNVSEISYTKTVTLIRTKHITV